MLIKGTLKLGFSCTLCANAKKVMTNRERKLDNGKKKSK